MNNTNFKQKRIINDDYSIKIDPLEQTIEYKKIEKELEEKIIKQLGTRRYRGYCHRYWSLKKKILLEDYHMDWKSPASLNPFVKFD